MSNTLRLGTLTFRDAAGKPTMIVNVPFDSAASPEAIGVYVGANLHARGHRRVALNVLRDAAKYGQALIDGCGPAKWF